MRSAVRIRFMSERHDRLNVVALSLSRSLHGWGKNCCAAVSYSQAATPPLDRRMTATFMLGVVLLLVGDARAHELRAAEVCVGSRHSCALLAGGEVRCWGWNMDGQLGTGRTRRANGLDFKVTPQRVVGIGRAEEITCGHDFTCARLSDGTARCWGNGRYGQLGNGGATSSSAPVQVRTARKVSSICSGSVGSCILSADGHVECWPPGPPSRVPLPSRAKQLVCGTDHYCAQAHVTGEWSCWYDDPRRPEGPQKLVIAPENSRVWTGGDITCAATTAQVQCEGGSICSPGKARRPHAAAGEPWQLPPGPAGESLILSVQRACATREGALTCWGKELAGEVRPWEELDCLGPTRVELPGRVGTADLGPRHACAVLTDGQVFCWGDNSTGQLGNGTVVPRVRPTEVIWAPRVKLPHGPGDLGEWSFTGQLAGRRKVTGVTGALRQDESGRLSGWMQAAASSTRLQVSGTWSGSSLSLLVKWRSGKTFARLEGSGSPELTFSGRVLGRDGQGVFRLVASDDRERRPLPIRWTTRTDACGSYVDYPALATAPGSSKAERTTAAEVNQQLERAALAGFAPCGPTTIERSSSIRYAAAELLVVTFHTYESAPATPHGDRSSRTLMLTPKTGREVALSELLVEGYHPRLLERIRSKLEPEHREHLSSSSVFELIPTHEGLEVEFADRELGRSFVEGPVTVSLEYAEVADLLRLGGPLGIFKTSTLLE
jgi:alpha-tubulin suppressor-like RCC1 family protein